VIGYGLYDRVRFSELAVTFHFTTTFTWALGPIQLLYVMGALTPEAKRPERETIDHLPSNTEVGLAYSYTSTSRTPSRRCAELITEQYYFHLLVYTAHKTTHFL